MFWEGGGGVVLINNFSAGGGRWGGVMAINNSSSGEGVGVDYAWQDSIQKFGADFLKKSSFSDISIHLLDFF